MAQVADFVLGRLRERGVHRVFGYPGDGINGMLDAFDRTSGDPEFIQARHEETAAFMTCGHAKFTGEVGCCVATSGPGVCPSSCSCARVPRRYGMSLTGRSRPR